MKISTACSLSYVDAKNTQKTKKTVDQNAG
jgi:hypothetical protein